MAELFWNEAERGKMQAGINNIKGAAQKLVNNQAINLLSNYGSENFIVVPASIGILQFLASLLAGDRDEESIGNSVEKDEDFHEAIKFTRNLLEGKSDLLGNEVTILHNVWLENGLKLDKEVQKLIATYCETRILPLANDKIINIKKLQRKLQQLNKSGIFTDELRTAEFSEISPLETLFVSAVYITMEWREPFLSSLTTKGTFRISETESIEAEMMVQKGGMVCVTCKNLNATVLQLPLTARNMCLLVFLPNEKTKGVDTISGRLTADVFQELMRQLGRAKPAPVYVTLPKFSLKHFGMLPGRCEIKNQDDRSPEASGCRILHMTKLTINEFGLNTRERKSDQSEATVISHVMHDGIKWTHFTASSPFLIALVELEYELIFLIGKVERPEITNNDRRCSGGRKVRRWRCI
ncbi:serpin B5-like [Dendronephthya gigantea]|uniref:serpin B5-like n=1 Tax=Dendronephthya gigantea TaxID=151771 RepID=UPI0010697138|nr:serpin B5-like [Dendronephthya gigantea]XP_028395161.1 serpin B5-like [Dendronephthya gigantea]XP_028395162.1 serpin B5-like [Dendronephthya gigantea]